MADNLCAVVNSDGMPARLVSPAEALAGWRAGDRTPDLLLVNAALNLSIVRQLAQRITRTTSRPPTVVMFAERDFRELEEHVMAGLDYIIPPFLPGLIGSRLGTRRLIRAPTPPCWCTRSPRPTGTSPRTISGRGTSPRCSSASSTRPTVRWCM